MSKPQTKAKGILQAVTTTLAKPPWRTILLGFLILAIVTAAYWGWSPGVIITDGRHDKGKNGIWLQHGWLGADEWFIRNNKGNRIAEFRDLNAIEKLAAQLSEHQITDVFPHVAPVGPLGKLSPVNHHQVLRFLNVFTDFRVIPWIGGVLNDHCHPDREQWRKLFCKNVDTFLKTYPQLAGIHLNIEPWPCGNSDILLLLDELRCVIPENKILSVAAYPPPTIWHRHEDLHWDENYYREVSRRCDQIVVMMYDTALSDSKRYRKLMNDWTIEILNWSKSKEVLLSIPTYNDSGTGYHIPSVENIPNALAGIHQGLSSFTKTPDNYQGISIYCEWETDESEWCYFKNHFLSMKKTNVNEKKGTSLISAGQYAFTQQSVTPPFY